jgi:inorganic pyrophosphatase
MPWPSIAQRARTGGALAAGACVLAALALGCAAAEGGANGDPYRMVSDVDFLRGHPAVNADGTANVVIEIPAGTTAKWEVDASDGSMRHEFRDGRPRVVAYLGYPGNYGMVPRTLLPAETGGDGDPLDVLVLGSAVPRGSVVAVRVVAVLHTRDSGERDDKLIAVSPGPGPGGITSLEELEARLPGATRIIETWFSSYKGPGVVESSGWDDADVAQAILRRAAVDFEAAEARRSAGD